MASRPLPARHLVVFVREPRIGLVKRRLAADIGDVAAWRFYRQATRALLVRLSGGNHWQRWLAVTPDAAARAPGLWPAGWRRIEQGPGELGERMTRVMHRLPPGPVVIIGSDVPDLRPAHIAQAFRALGRHHAVFGPAADGGYWLVGLRRRRRYRDFFAGVRWSSPFALADTLANLGPLDAALLETLEDIDDGAALARWRRRQACRQAQCFGRSRST